MDKMFDYFLVKELFRQNSEKEVLYLLRNSYLDKLLVLLMFLDSFRQDIETPIIITSAFRDELHNIKVGGSSSSQHLVGEAIDFACSGLKFSVLKDKFKKFCKETALTKYLGQVIFYNQKQFIHVALRSQKHPKLMYYEK